MNIVEYLNKFDENEIETVTQILAVKTVGGWRNANIPLAEITEHIGTVEMEEELRGLREWLDTGGREKLADYRAICQRHGIEDEMTEESLIYSRVVYFETKIKKWKEILAAVKIHGESNREEEKEN